MTSRFPPREPLGIKRSAPAGERARGGRAAAARRLGECRRRARGVRARSARPRTVSDPGPGGGGGGGRGVGPERRFLPSAPRRPAGGSPRGRRARLSGLFLSLVSFRSALFRVGLGGFSGRRAAPGAGRRLVRAQRGDEPARPPRRSLRPRAGRGNGCPGGGPLSASPLEPRSRRRAPGPGGPARPELPASVQTTLLFAEVFVCRPRDAGARRRAPQRPDRPGRSRCG